MRKELTKEQSAKISGYGIAPYYSSKYRFIHRLDEGEIIKLEPGQFIKRHKRYVKGVGIKEIKILNQNVFTTSDLLSILPEEIVKGSKTYSLRIKWDCKKEEWNAGYHRIFKKEICVSGKELTDALYQLVIKSIESGYIKITGCGTVSYF